MTPVRTTRLFSEIELLEYQVDSKTEGVLDPMQRRKHALRKSLLNRYDTFEMTKNLQICNAFIVEDVYGAQDNETYVTHGYWVLRVQQKNALTDHGDN